MANTQQMEPAEQFIALIAPQGELSEITLREAIGRTALILDQWAAGSDITTVEPGLLAQSLRLVLAATSGGIGECRLAIPYSPMRPVNTTSGFKWCCNHKPPHCS